MACWADGGLTLLQVLVGGKDGVYQFDQKLVVATSTVDGVKLNFTAAKKGEKADLILRSAYDVGRYGFSATVNTTDKVAVTASVAEVAPGLKATLAATLPDASSGKLTLDYATKHAFVRSVIGLTSSPKVDMYVTSAYKNMLVGVHGGYDTAKSELSGYTAGAGARSPNGRQRLLS